MHLFILFKYSQAILSFLTIVFISKNVPYSAQPVSSLLFQKMRGVQSGRNDSGITYLVEGHRYFNFLKVPLHCALAEKRINTIRVDKIMFEVLIFYSIPRYSGLN